MFFWIKIAHIITSVLLIVAVLLQNKGGGMGSAFGGSSGGGGIGGGAYLTKRGMEKKLHISTVVLAAIFILLSLAVFMTA